MLDYRRWLRAAAALSWLCAASAAAAGADPSDLWWNPAESGWGMQLVQGGDVAFATLFVYGANGRPTFYTATLSPAGNAWTGPLYETTGPYFAADPYDPSGVAVRGVGSMTFTLATTDTGRLDYVVDGITVIKNVTRQTLRFDNYSGSYPVTVQRMTSHCPDPSANGDRTAMERLAIVHEGTAIGIDWTWPQRACHHAGAYQQSGRLGAAQTSYTCDDGEAGDLALFDLALRGAFVTGRFQGHSISNGCDYRGQFAGFLPE